MANMFLAGYFLSRTLDYCRDKEWGWAVAYGAIVVLNLVLGLCLE